MVLSTTLPFLMVSKRWEIRRTKDKYIATLAIVITILEILKKHYITTSCILILSCWETELDMDARAVSLAKTIMVSRISNRQYTIMNNTSKLPWRLETGTRKAECVKILATLVAAWAILNQPSNGTKSHLMLLKKQETRP